MKTNFWRAATGRSDESEIRNDLFESALDNIHESDVAATGEDVGSVAASKVEGTAATSLRNGLGGCCGNG